MEPPRPPSPGGDSRPCATVRHDGSATDEQAHSDDPPAGNSRRVERDTLPGRTEEAHPLAAALSRLTAMLSSPSVTNHASGRQDDDEMDDGKPVNGPRFVPRGAALSMLGSPLLASGAMRAAAVAHAPAALACVAGAADMPLPPAWPAVGKFAPFFSIHTLVEGLKLLVAQDAPAPPSRLAGGAGLLLLMRQPPTPPQLAAFAALRPPPVPSAAPPPVAPTRAVDNSLMDLAEAATVELTDAHLPVSMPTADPPHDLASPSAAMGAPAKAELGRATWTLLHTLAAQLPEQPTRQQQRDAKALIDVLTRIYPCGDCARHFAEVVRHDPPVVSSGREFQGWLCRVHNVVNRRLSKPTFNCDVAAARWQPLDCSDGDDGASPGGCNLTVGNVRR